ncbi:MAG: hypothetical protein JO209_01655 [Acidisphaera sp.]|nr:hypothetical protein [Acidisphaera sp.]
MPRFIPKRALQWLAGIVGGLVLLPVLLVGLVLVVLNVPPGQRTAENLVGEARWALECSRRHARSLRWAGPRRRAWPGSAWRHNAGAMQAA